MLTVISEKLDSKMKNTKFEIKIAMKKVWMPDENYKFPKNGKGNTFQRSWFSLHPWLAYSHAVEGAYCKMCVLFGQATSERNSVTGQLVSQPYLNWIMQNPISSVIRRDPQYIHLQKQGMQVSKVSKLIRKVKR